jgi:bifunctional NMN adenylyltransferase/nudix hydrolase
MGNTYTAFVLRGQPFHNAHQKIIRNALKESDKVIVLIGSYRTSITIKNPWSFEDRSHMIRGCFNSADNARIIIAPIRDYLYSINTWVTSLQNVVSSIAQNNPVSLIGHFKDDSSYYLNWFPQWKLITQPNFKTMGGDNIDGTTIRKLMFEGDNFWRICVPDFVAGFLGDYIHTDEFQQLKKEYDYIVKYRKSWESSPYPPTFVTTDAVVIQSGHVLLIKRKREPGKGYFAIPGGFLNQKETIRQGTIRELKEETKIDVPAVILEKCIKQTVIFDHPGRSLRGRIITHASLIELDSTKPLPKVKGDDDASEAIWMPFNDLGLHEEQCFEDHFHIVQSLFTGNLVYNR